MINPRLFDWYGIDTTKNLKIKSICGRPFNTILIDKNGSCFACECTSWLPQSVGNLQKLELEEIINSDLIKLMRQSVSDGTYKYCNEKQCPYILSTYIKNTEYSRYKELKNIRLAIDDSCNLSCPSCRNKTIFLYKGKVFKMRLKLVDKILKYLQNNKQKNFNIHIGSDGDPFASLIYRNFMKRTGVFKHLSYSILTNGLLIKKNFFKFRHVIDNLQTLGLSIDGATKSTYEELRRGGSFDKIIENLEFIKTLDRKFKLELHCVVQQKNYKEMYEYIELGKRFDVDKIYFNKITNWNVLADFKDRAVWLPEHPENNIFKNIVKDIENTRYEKEFFVETINLT
jgi:MoaA/NifB/PqqE/SkfB family radical SAM enzyme